ncbi:hypothetical protein IWZ00DRAFT_169563 [Phyllosticta capitalensis]
MSSFFGKFRANAQTPASPSSAASPAKKDPNAPQPTPLERLLAADTGPIRPDGSDKFFGFENVRNCFPRLSSCRALANLRPRV